jgi:hypothetical protein
MSEAENVQALRLSEEGKDDRSRNCGELARLTEVLQPLTLVPAPLVQCIVTGVAFVMMH